MSYGHHKILVRREIWVLRTNPDGGYSEMVEAEGVRRISNVLPDPVFLEVADTEVEFSAAYGGLFDAVEELSYVGNDAIETTDEGLTAAVGRPVAALLDIWEEEEGSADYLPQLIAAGRRLVDAVVGYRRSAFVSPELATAVDRLAEELSSVPLRTTL